MASISKGLRSGWPGSRRLGYIAIARRRKEKKFKSIPKVEWRKNIYIWFLIHFRESFSSKNPVVIAAHNNIYFHPMKELQI